MEPIMKQNNIISYVNTDCSPSHLINNLTFSNNHIMYIHNSELQPRIITVDKKLFYETRPEEMIAQHVNILNNKEINEMTIIKCIQLADTYYIAIGLYGGFKLYSVDGSRLLFNIPCKIKVSEKPYAFTAVTGFRMNPLNKQYDSIVCGDNYGQIFLVTGSGLNWKGKIIHTKVEGLTPTAMTSGISSNSVSIGYETGEVIVLRVASNGVSAEVIDTIPSPGNLPCLEMGVIEPTKSGSMYLINCFLNGEVRIYKNAKPAASDKLTLVSILGAHIRIITSLAIYKNYFMTAGEDCFVNIWKLDEDENISLQSSHELKDRIPVGVVLNVKSDGTDVIACCYDQTYLAVIKGLTFN